MKAHHTILTPDGALKLELGTEPIDLAGSGPVFRATRTDTGEVVLFLHDVGAVLSCRTPTPGTVELGLHCGRGDVAITVDWQARTFRFPPSETARPLQDLAAALDETLPPWPRNTRLQPTLGAVARSMLALVLSLLFAAIGAWEVATNAKRAMAWGALFFFSACAAVFLSDLRRVQRRRREALARQRAK